MAGFGITKAPKYGKAVASWVKGKLSPKTTPDKSKLDLLKSEGKVLTHKAKMVNKLAADVKANPHVFKESKAFKEGRGKFGFNKPSGKK